jgi:ribosome-associated toxin RatA of RatAB toxin-antitoxin module
MQRANTQRAISFSAALAFAMMAPWAAHAAGGAEIAASPLAERRPAKPGRDRAIEEPTVESFAVPDTKIQRVRATVVVSAPVDRVRAVVFDFPRYPEFMLNYTKATVLGTTANGGGLVQMEMKELGGAIRFWMRVEVSPASVRGGAESYSGRLLAGNVKAFEPRWELEALDAQRTRFTVESFMDPDLALVPSSAVNDGARRGVRDAILAQKARAEGKPAAAR